MKPDICTFEYIFPFNAMGTTTITIFQQDGAPSYYTRAVNDSFPTEVSKSCICRDSPENQTAGSPGPTLRDYFCENM